MRKIVVLDRDTYAPEIDTHGPNIEHEWIVYGATAPEQILERTQGAHIVITNKVPMRAETLAQLPDLRMISVSATGFDVIDTVACEERGITVSNVRGYAVHTLPEHTFALILSLRRQIIGYRQDVIEGKWQASGQFCFHTHPMKDLHGSTLGIIGEGNLGQSVAELGKAFGMRVLFAAHKGVEGLGPLYTPFQQVMEESDVISLHCPLTPHTRNVLAMPDFRQMKRQPIIVNTSRGGLVHEGDLVQALNEGLIAGFGFDVLTKEPPAQDNPILSVLERPNVIVTPHMAWASHEAQVECWRQTVANIENFTSGAASNVVV